MDITSLDLFYLPGVLYKQISPHEKEVPLVQIADQSAENFLAPLSLCSNRVSQASQNSASSVIVVVKLSFCK